MDTWDIQSLLRVSFKTRLDGYTDQYNRILMVKVLLACTFIMGINWYEDKMNCIIPESHLSSKQFTYFVQSACWMKGLYVYKEMRSQMSQAAFYGMPIHIEYDGMQSKQFPCVSKSKDGDFGTTHTYYNAVDTKTCIPMKKTFYLQYQWMPFFIGLLSFFYYLPFMVFRLANKDIVCLEDDAEILTPQEITKHYFHDLGLSKDSKNKQKFIKRLLMYMLIKFLYVFVNIGALLTSDRLLEGEFLNYLPKWVHWSTFNNSISYDYMGARDFPKPGNELLPPFGYCEVYSSANDEIASYVNKHKLVCELSQHVLYQYVFILLWACIVVGCAVSIIGLILSLINCGYLCQKYSNTDDRRSWEIFSKFLSYRHREYLELLKNTNINMYDDVVSSLNTIVKKKSEKTVHKEESENEKVGRSTHRNNDTQQNEQIKRRYRKVLGRKSKPKKKESHF